MTQTGNLFKSCPFCGGLKPEIGSDCDKRKHFRCGNLVQDGSFESQYANWVQYNAIYTNVSVHEGAIQARLGPGVASIYQEVSLRDTGDRPFFFSFNAVSNVADTEEFNSGTLIAEVIWLDGSFSAIGTGLRMFIPKDRINNVARITFFSVTDRPPANAAYAKILFTKGEGEGPDGQDLIFIDSVVFAAMAGVNLLKNRDFEANLFEWIPNPPNDTAFLSSYKESLEGAGHAQTHFTGTLSQDIDVRFLPPLTSFLVSFAVGGIGLTTLAVRVEWLDYNGNVIGSGLNISIPNETLANQGNYLSYLNITYPMVPGTAFARLTFFATVPTPTDFVRLDNVLFVPVPTTNLITNPSFENGLANWYQSLVTLVQRNDVYEGTADAGIGEIGGALWQDVPLQHAEGHCYLFSVGLGYRLTTVSQDCGHMIMRVIWLDKYDNEIGQGLSLISSVEQPEAGFLQWIPYVGITEPAPQGTAKARILFTKTDSVGCFIEIDNVTFARII